MSLATPAGRVLVQRGRRSTDGGRRLEWIQLEAGVDLFVPGKMGAKWYKYLSLPGHVLFSKGRWRVQGHVWKLLVHRTQMLLSPSTNPCGISQFMVAASPSADVPM